MALSATDVQDQNRSEVPTQTNTNTGFGNMIGKCLATRQPFVLPRYTTLNERYNVLAEESIGPKHGKDFELKYFGIGVRGSNCNGTDANGVSKMKINQHQPTDMNLFVQIPFACRPLDDDFDNLNRAKYRMRVVENGYDGNAYAFYYIKLINFDRYNPEVSKITRDENGNELPVPYTPDRDSLFNPQPVDFTSVGSVPVSDTYLNYSGLLDCTLNAQDLQEIMNACRIKFNDAGYGSVSETCVYWGYDTVTDGRIGQGATIRYDEVMSCVASHFVTEKDGRNAQNNTEIELAYDHGASEPMLLHTTSTASAQSQGN